MLIAGRADTLPNQLGSTGTTSFWQHSRQVEYDLTFGAFVMAPELRDLKTLRVLMGGQRFGRAGDNARVGKGSF